MHNTSENSPTIIIAHKTMLKPWKHPLTMLKSVKMYNRAVHHNKTACKLQNRMSLQMSMQACMLDLSM